MADNVFCSIERELRAKVSRLEQECKVMSSLSVIQCYKSAH